MNATNCPSTNTRRRSAKDPSPRYTFSEDAAAETMGRRRVGLPLDEVEMVASCIQFDECAWELMFRVYHPRLVRSIESMLFGDDRRQQAEEVAATVWELLCHREISPLQRFDPSAGRLISFLVGLARREIWKARRSALSRHTRECKAARREWTIDENFRGIAMQEFLATLTRREHEYCVTYLLRPADPAYAPALSRNYKSQLRGRVLKKFRLYFEQSK